MKVMIAIGLALTSFAQANESRQGVLKINGKAVTKPFKLEMMVHTQEVKPEGTIVASYCGTPAELKDVEVCEAQPEGRPDQHYIVLQKKDRTVYVKAQTSIQKSSPTTTIHSGYGVDSDERFPAYDVEKKFELRLVP